MGDIFYWYVVKTGKELEQFAIFVSEKSIKCNVYYLDLNFRTILLREWFH